MRRASASGTPSARNAAKRNEHGFGVLARAQRSEHVRPSLESNPRGQQDGRLIEYVTDGKGRRIGKMVNGVLTKQWIYRDQLKPVAELDGTGNLVSEFIYGTKSNVPDLVVRGGVTYRLVSDQLGSPVLAINSANSSDVPFQATYAAFGERTLVAGIDDWMPFGFAGGTYDPDTKLTRFGWRDYYATTGRWVGKEPLRFVVGKNFYAFSLNDPVNYVDLTGLAPAPPGGAGGATGNGGGGTEGTSGTGSDLPGPTPPGPDWCGTGWYSGLIPEQIGGTDFSSSCAKHDDCYSNCDSSKESCDSQLGSNLVRACIQQNGGPGCYAAAFTYEGAVRAGGDDAYSKAQSSCGCR